MVLHEYNLDFLPEQYDFNIVPLWVQMHGIPRYLVFVEIIHKIACSIGKVVEMECMPHNEILTWKFARAKIELNVLKSISARKLLKQTHPNNNPVWIQCRYGRLFEFCHKCELLTHITCQCQATGVAFIFLNDGSQHLIYGFWLKASLRQEAPVIEYIRKHFKKGNQERHFGVRIKVPSESSNRILELQNLQLAKPQSDHDSANKSDAIIGAGPSFM